MLHRKTSKTIVHTLLENPRAINNDALRVWVKMKPSDDGLYDQLQSYIDELPPEEWFFTLIPAHEGLGLEPGSHLLFLEYLRGAGFQVDLVRLPLINPILSTPQGCFIKGVPTLSFNDMRLGKLTELTAAAGRARRQAPNADWMGGIADFATNFFLRHCF